MSEPLALSLGQQFELERMNRAIEATADPQTLQGIAKQLLDPSHPSGCFVTNSTCEAGSTSLPDKATETIHAINRRSTESFLTFFKEEESKGNLKPQTDPELLADSLLTIRFGLAVMARNGATEDRLTKVIDHGVSLF